MQTLNVTVNLPTAYNTLTQPARYKKLLKKCMACGGDLVLLMEKFGELSPDISLDSVSCSSGIRTAPSSGETAGAMTGGWYCSQCGLHVLVPKDLAVGVENGPVTSTPYSSPITSKDTNGRTLNLQSALQNLLLSIQEEAGHRERQLEHCHTHLTSLGHAYEALLHHIQRLTRMDSKLHDSMSRAVTINESSLSPVSHMSRGGRPWVSRSSSSTQTDRSDHRNDSENTNALKVDNLHRDTQGGQYNTVHPTDNSRVTLNTSNLAQSISSPRNTSKDRVRHDISSPEEGHNSAGMERRVAPPMEAVVNSSPAERRKPIYEGASPMMNLKNTTSHQQHQHTHQQHQHTHQHTHQQHQHMHQQHQHTHQQHQTHHTRTQQQSVSHYSQVSKTEKEHGSKTESNLIRMENDVLLSPKLAQGGLHANMHKPPERRDLMPPDTRLIDIQRTPKRKDPNDGVIAGSPHFSGENRPQKRVQQMKSPDIDGLNSSQLATPQDKGTGFNRSRTPDALTCEEHPVLDKSTRNNEIKQTPASKFQDYQTAETDNHWAKKSTPESQGFARGVITQGHENAHTRSPQQAVQETRKPQVPESMVPVKAVTSHEGVLISPRSQIKVTPERSNVSHRQIVPNKPLPSSRGVRDGPPEGLNHPNRIFSPIEPAMTSSSNRVIHTNAHQTPITVHQHYKPPNAAHPIPKPRQQNPLNDVTNRDQVNIPSTVISSSQNSRRRRPTTAQEPTDKNQLATSCKNDRNNVSNSPSKEFPSRIQELQSQTRGEQDKNRSYEIVPDDANIFPVNISAMDLRHDAPIENSNQVNTHPKSLVAEAKFSNNIPPTSKNLKNGHERHVLPGKVAQLRELYSAGVNGAGQGQPSTQRAGLVAAAGRHRPPEAVGRQPVVSPRNPINSRSALNSKEHRRVRSEERVLDGPAPSVTNQGRAIRSRSEDRQLENRSDESRQHHRERIQRAIEHKRGHSEERVLDHPERKGQQSRSRSQERPPENRVDRNNHKNGQMHPTQQPFNRSRLAGNAASGSPDILEQQNLAAKRSNLRR